MIKQIEPKMNNEGKKETISFLIANYNNAKYIDDCMESVLAQTNNNWKAYVLDDLSTDDSKKILEKYKDNDKIKIVFSEKNEGYAGTLKKLVELAETDIVGILDSDDALYPNAGEVMLNYYQDHQEAEFVYSQFHMCDTNMKVFASGFSAPINPKQVNIFRLSKYLKVSHFKTFRKSAYSRTEGFDPEIECAVDKDIALKISEVTSLHFIDKILYKWRETGSSLSTGIANKQRCRYYINLIVAKAVIRRHSKSIHHTRF